MRFLKGIPALCALGFACSATASDLDLRAAAASAAANSPACQSLSFYWEIGDRDGNYRSGTVGTTAVKRTDLGPIASAGKWLYAAYALEKEAGAPDPVRDLPFLNITSGYDKQAGCSGTNTVAQCGASSGLLAKDKLDAGQAGAFSYDSGHFQAHAATDWAHVLGLASFQRAALGPPIAAALHIPPDRKIPNPSPTAFSKQIEIGLHYNGPTLAADASIDAGSYASFLQQVLRGDLQMSKFLGADAVCASTQKDAAGRYYCSDDGGATTRVGTVPPLPGAALDAATPADGDPWRYSIGHWVEKDGSFSSIGALGFYPWIDASKTWYGIVTRSSTLNQLAYKNVLVCGQAIRNSWLKAVPATPK